MGAAGTVDGLRAEVGVSLGSLRLDVSLSAGTGGVTALLGPNGAGKTTLLRTLAGLVPLEAGRVVLDGEVLEDATTGTRLPPEERPVAVMFQDHRLFPNMSALDNVAFGLRCRGVPRAEARRRAAEWLERMNLGAQADARPGELSGGQSQRVALARALAIDPRLLLLDEPLSALDASTRVTVRRQLREHLASFNGVRLLVTHDPLDAISLADVLVVLEAGSVVQVGTVPEISARPRSRYVAQLVGVNLYAGRAHGDRVVLPGGGSLSVIDAGTGDVLALVHPRNVSVHRREPEGTPRNVWPGTVESLDLEGDRVRLRITGEIPVVAEVTTAAVSELHLADGDPVWVSVKAAEVDVYPA